MIANQYDYPSYPASFSRLAPRSFGHRANGAADETNGGDDQQVLHPRRLRWRWLRPLPLFAAVVRVLSWSSIGVVPRPILMIAPRPNSIVAEIRWCGPISRGFHFALPVRRDEFRLMRLLHRPWRVFAALPCDDVGGDRDDIRGSDLAGLARVTIRVIPA